MKFRSQKDIDPPEKIESFLSGLKQECLYASTVDKTKIRVGAQQRKLVRFYVTNVWVR